MKILHKPRSSRGSYEFMSWESPSSCGDSSKISSRSDWSFMSSVDSLMESGNLMFVADPGEVTSTPVKALSTLLKDSSMLTTTEDCEVTTEPSRHGYTHEVCESPCPSLCKHRKVEKENSLHQQMPKWVAIVTCISLGLFCVAALLAILALLLERKDPVSQNDDAIENPTIYFKILPTAIPTPSPSLPVY